MPVVPKKQLRLKGSLPSQRTLRVGTSGKPELREKAALGISVKSMPKRTLDSPDSLKALVGQEIAVTGWFAVAQERIQQFADATLDHQWIHVDVERSKRESPFGAPIAHGFLTLSLLPHLMHEALEMKNGIRMGVNYGLNHLRFVSPVRSGSKLRGRFTLQSIKDVPGNGLEAVYKATVEGENAEKPFVVAEWVVRYYR
jgi:acyl dehydratase